MAEEFVEYERDIIKILGHCKVKTTIKYLYLDFDRMKRAIEVFGENTKERKKKKKSDKK